MKDYIAYDNKSLDGRYKILPSEYKKVKALYKEMKSSRKVAKIYNVDKKIILFIVSPAYKARDTRRRIENKVWLRYYDREEHTKAIREYRAKKRSLNHYKDIK